MAVGTQVAGRLSIDTQSKTHVNFPHAVMCIKKLKRVYTRTCTRTYSYVYLKLKRAASNERRTFTDAGLRAVVRVDAAPLVGEHHLEARVDGRVRPRVTARHEDEATGSSNIADIRDILYSSCTSTRTRRASALRASACDRKCVSGK